MMEGGDGGGRNEQSTPHTKGETLLPTAASSTVCVCVCKYTCVFVCKQACVSLIPRHFN